MTIQAEGTGIDMDDEYAASHAVAARRPDTAFWALRNNGEELRFCWSSQAPAAAHARLPV